MHFTIADGIAILNYIIYMYSVSITWKNTAEQPRTVFVEGWSLRATTFYDTTGLINLSYFST